jgi:YggT family protein
MGGGAGYGFDALQFLISTLITLYALIILLRFMMQAVRADYYNPVAQFVVKASAPVLRPLRRVIPPFGRYDIAALLVALALMLLKLWLYRLLGIPDTVIGGYRLGIEHAWFGSLAWLAVVDLLALIFNVFFFAVLIRAILTWVAPPGPNPIIELLERITAPVVNPVRRVVPLIGGIDISPLIVLIGLQVVRMLLIPPLLALA